MKKNRIAEAMEELEPAPELLEASGSTEQYHKDMRSFVDRALKEIDRLKQTKAGREKLKKAGLMKRKQ